MSHAPARPQQRQLRALGKALVLTIVAANAAVILWLWLHDGGVTRVHSMGQLLTSAGRITGLLGAYLLLIQLLLLGRLRRIERLVGYDRLTTWHRINGMVCLSLILAHVALITIGYSLTDRLSIPKEVSTLFALYPGILQATIGTGLLILVVATSIVIVRRRLRYGLWYLVHLTAYVAVLLAWFHQVPTGNEFVLNAAAAKYWTLLYLATLLLLLLFRLVLPILLGFRHQMRVAEVVVEGPHVVSLRITGRHLDRLGALAGQFFLWRFLTPKLAWESHPFSLSAAPDGQSFRITVKSLGDFTSRIGEIKPGTRVLGVGPFGLFTDAERSRDKVALIAGGVGITPIRALLEEMSGDVALIYRVTREADGVFRDELEELCRDREIAVHYVAGSHRAPGGERLLSSEHLKELIPDIARREVYICGPAAMSDRAVVNARKAGVPHKYIHFESFAFSPEMHMVRGLLRNPLLVRRSLFAFGGVLVAAIVGRFAWVATHSPAAATKVVLVPTGGSTKSPNSKSAAVPTPKPTAVPAPVTYTGPVVTGPHEPVQVAIIVKGGAITDVAVSTTPSEPRSQAIEAQAIPILKSETLQAQSATIDTVSGATETSDAYIQSLGGALSKRHR